MKLVIAALPNHHLDAKRAMRRSDSSV